MTDRSLASRTTVRDQEIEALVDQFRQMLYRLLDRELGYPPEPRPVGPWRLRRPVVTPYSGGSAAIGDTGAYIGTNEGSATMPPGGGTLGR